METSIRVPATETFDHAVQFDRFDSWSFMLPTPQTIFSPPLSAAARFLQLVTAVVRKPFVETPSTLWTFHRAVPSPFFPEIELTENQCRSVW